MKIADVVAKKLFSLRKMTWLFLCGMLVVSGESCAQQADQVKGPADNDRPAANRPMVVKYGPPSWFRPDLRDDQAPTQAPDAKAPGTQGNAQGTTGTGGKEDGKDLQEK